MITDDTELMGVLYAHMNARIGPIEIVHKCRHLEAGANPLEPQVLRLPVNDREAYQQLVDFEYVALLEGVVAHFEIDQAFDDVFRSELSDSLVDLFRGIMKTERANATISHDGAEGEFRVHTTDTFADLIIAPVSELHTEVVATLQYANAYVSGVSGNMQGLFLNANASTAFSYFIQIWIAEHLKIPMTPGSDILVF